MIWSWATFARRQAVGVRDACDVIVNEKDRESELNMLRISVVRFQMKHVWAKEPLKERLEAAQVPHDPDTWRSPFKGFRCVAY